MMGDNYFPGCQCDTLLFLRQLILKHSYSDQDGSVPFYWLSTAGESE